MLPPIEHLTWNHEQEVTSHFRALLAEFGFSLPREAVLDGESVAVYAGSPTSREEDFCAKRIQHLAGGLSPSEFYRRLYPHQGTTGGVLPLAEFLKTMGVWPGATAWFKYQEQSNDIIEFALTFEKKPFRILVHSTWNGEDAFSIYIAFKALAPSTIIQVVGMDYICPRPEFLQWISLARIPRFLKQGWSKWFDKKTERVLAPKRSLLKKIELCRGDVRDDLQSEAMFEAVVINGLLGQGVTDHQSIERALTAARCVMVPEGRLFIDNTAFGIRHPKQLECLNAVVGNMIASHVFEAIFARFERGQYILRRLA